MIHFNLLLIGLIAGYGISSVAEGRKIINCFYNTFVNFIGDVQSVVHHMDPHLCTHISYDFFKIDGRSGLIQVREPWATKEKIAYEVVRTELLKITNPNLKIMFIIDGWASIHQIVASATRTKHFIESAMNITQKYNVDGLILDWAIVEYIRNPADLQTLLTNTYKAMKSIGKQLDVIVSGGETEDSPAYDIPGISKNVDFINIRPLNFLNRAMSVKDLLKSFGIKYLESVIKSFMKQGAPDSKLVVILPFFGHVFKIVDPKKYKKSSQAVRIEGPIVLQTDVIDYPSVCKMKNFATNYWPDEHGVPHLLSDTQFVSYDNAKSIDLKVDLTNSLNLAGVMVWGVEADDVHGECGDGKFPLLNTIRKGFADLYSPSAVKKRKV